MRSRGPITPAMTNPSDYSSPRADPPAGSNEGYWRKNLTYLGILLSIWFAVSYGAGILFVEQLNNFYLPGTGFPLGFWFAQQGSMFIFIALILVYCIWVEKLDRAYHVEEDDRGGGE